MPLRKLGYTVELLGCVGMLLTGSIADNASVLVVTLGVIGSSLMLFSGKYLVGYSIYLKRKREEKMITRYRKEISA